MQKLTKARIKNSEASPSTQRKRKAQVLEMMQETTNDVPHLRKKLFNDSTEHKINAEETVSMMANLYFTWYKYKDWSG